MWIFLLLSAGLFMGWSLGTNDAANAFGTAVATRVVKYRTAIIIIATMVLLGAVLLGHQSIDKLSSIATNNEVSASQEDVDAAIQAGTLGELRLKSALKAFIVFACAAITVFVMSYLKFPVSANQSITGAVIGWGLCYADYSNPEILKSNLMEILEFMSTWLINPLGAAVISFVLVFFVKKFIEKKLTSMKNYDVIVKFGYIAAGAFSAFSIGQNSSASVTAFYYDATGAGANLIFKDFGWFTAARITAIIGGVAIAVGVLTFSKRVMMTVGGEIAKISQVDGFVVIIASALTVLLMGKLMGIPVSTSQSVVGAVIGAGLVNGVKNVNFGVFKRIAIAWVSSPTAAGLLTYLVALCTKSYFGA
ncbi:MAG: anion permease [Clostridia bacterium]|nr:anion permease [Clostridia bacterium]